MFRDALVRASDGLFDVSVEESQVIHLDTHPKKANVYLIRLFLSGWLSLLADSPLNKTRGRKPLRVFRTFKKSILTDPLRDTIMRFAALADAIVETTTCQGQGTVTGTFIDQMKETPIFKEYLEWYKSSDPVLLKYILSFLYFGKKMEYDDVELNQRAFRSWEGVEERLSGLQLDDDLMYGLKTILRHLVRHIPLTELGPKFGPGKVSERGVRDPVDKVRNLKWDAKLDRAFFSGYFAYFGHEEYGFRPDRVLPDPQEWNKAKRSSTTSRLKFVPKTVKTSRSICMEPNTFMFFQQAYRRHLTRVIDKSLAGRYIRLEDQSRNQDLARYGSYTGLLDTIDLSSASDSVSVELVRRIFPREILYFLLATRTSKVHLMDGSIRPVLKFAPMGSALCFPVQCLIFTTVCHYAALCLADGVDGRLDRSYWTNFRPKRLLDLFRRSTGWSSRKRSFEPLAVYGDDIVCDSRITQNVTHILRSLGFEVNSSKSFVGGQGFRESCGSYWHYGDDVTPLFFRVKPGGLKDPSCVASLVEACNRAGDYGYSSYQRLLLNHLKTGDSRQQHLLFSADRHNSLAIYHPRPRNDHLLKRYNTDLQREEIRSFSYTERVVRRPKGPERDPFERYQYLQWWVGTSSSSLEPSEASRPRSIRGDSRLSWRWTPREE